MAHDGVKHDLGKPMPARVFGEFPRAMLLVALVGQYGAEKYEWGDWLHVPDGLNRYTDAMQRHLINEHMESHDAESGLPHAAHAAWNAMARLELMLREVEKMVQDSGNNG